jgi:hypothetical protein
MALSRRLLVSGARKKPTTGSRTSFRFGLRSKKRCAHHPDKSTNGPVPSRRCASVSILQQALRIPLDHGKLGRLIEFSGRPPQEVDSSQHEDQQRGDRDATYSEKKFEQPIHNSTTETAKLRFPMNRSDSPKPVPRPYLIPARPARLLSAYPDGASRCGPCHRSIPLSWRHVSRFLSGARPATGLRFGLPRGHGRENWAGIRRRSNGRMHPRRLADLCALH